jgi:hypothetical protein
MPPVSSAPRGGRRRLSGEEGALQARVRQMRRTAGRSSQREGGAVALLSARVEASELVGVQCLHGRTWSASPALGPRLDSPAAACGYQASRRDSLSATLTQVPPRPRPVAQS